MTTYSVTTYRVKLEVNDGPVQATSSPAETIPILRAIYANLDADQEHVVVLALNGNNQVVGYKVISNGGMSFAEVDQKLLWRAALTLGGVAIILAHNHPSGNLHPSPNDIALTKRCQDAATMLGFHLLDHIILGHNKCFSFADQNLIIGQKRQHHERTEP